MGKKLFKKAITRPPAAIATGRKFTQGRGKARPIPFDTAMNGHQLVSGRTRVGKSSLLGIEANVAALKDPIESTVLVDSHASTSTRHLHACIRLGVPPERVIIIDLTKPEYGVPRLWLYDAEPGMEYVVVDGVTTCFREIWGKGIQDRAADIITQLGLTLQKSKTPITLANRFLLNKHFRSEVMEKCNDEELNDFWDYIFGMRNKEIVESTRNKLSALTGHTLIRPMLSDTSNSFSLFDAFNEGKIIIIDLNHAYFSLYPRGLLGSITLFLSYQALIKRKANLKYPKINFFLDEFAEYAVPEFYINYFTASGKYNVGLNIYTQTLDRFDAYDLNTILGNVGRLTSFSVGHKDAEILTKNMLTAFGEHVKKQKRDIYSILGFDKGYGEATYYSTGEEERNFRNELMNQMPREIITRIMGTNEIALYYGEVTEAPEYKVSEQEEHEYRIASAKHSLLPVEPQAAYVPPEDQIWIPSC